MRHPSFRGLRRDKRASEVHAESARRPDAATRSGTRPAVEPPRIRLTHPDRVLYAEQGITKADLARYYALVAERMLPHIARRPLMLLRCPEGRDKGCFFQKHPSRALPAGIERVRIREQKGMAQTMIVQNVEGLLGLVQLGALEIHAWGSRVDALEQPDQLVFDLDPDEALPWSRVVEAAGRVRANLLDRGLRSFLKTTGGKGLHVVVPIEASAKWDEVQAFCKALVESIAREEPDRYVTDMAKAKRKGKVFLDYLRNSRGATAVCAYSTRAREGVPVAAPIAWDELTSSLRSEGVTLADMPERLAGHDPWHDFFAVRQALPKA